jgi:hypothetical protein
MQDDWGMTLLDEERPIHSEHGQPEKGQSPESERRQAGPSVA